MAFPKYGGPSRLPSVLLCLFLAIQFSAICLAQSNTAAGRSSLSPTTSTTASSAAAQTHTIQVGLIDHVFKPDSVVANIGDTIAFDFYPLNHSVVRAEYGFPCIPYEMTGPNKTGFFSGFNAVDTVLSSPPTYRIRINDTNPVFFYCSAPGSCIDRGMVGAINPNASTSVAHQHELALNSTYMLNPGEPFPAESPLPSNLPTGSGTPGLSGSLPPHPHHKSLSGGAIAGIVIGAISVIVLAALLFFFWGRAKSLKEEVNRKAGTVRRLSPSSSSAAMLGPGSAGGGGGAAQVNGGGAGVGVYQTYQQQHSTTTSPMSQRNHMYSHELGNNGTYAPPANFSVPAPAYFATHTHQPAKYDMNSSPTAYTPPPVELPPTASFQHILHNAPAPTFPRTNTPPLRSYSPFSSYNHFRSASPHCLALMDKEGQPGAGAACAGGGCNTTSSPLQHDDMIPSYFESVYRREQPLFVNQRSGPVEMEGSEVGYSAGSGGGGEGKGDEAEGKGRGVVGTAGTTPRWEEVVVVGEEGVRF
ncbi:extracellular serine-rich [Pyrenophora seminiperda CCB06]|uniref:Extracellular serine-rich n=1 Tax=Pyrenophora seminiperda CCB06 TaxID=1302712 RepID=A0A3M7MG43_9PLEO|nr:extracellular serine-rich [Pyrenophora seminiperda CCB06]